MVATLSVLSRRCAGCGTAICCARPLLSLLRPIARLSEIEGHGAARWRRPPGHPEKAAWDRYSGGRDTGPRCQTAIEGLVGARWRGQPRRPEKAAWDCYSGGRDTGPRCQTAIEGLVGARWRGQPRRPEKAAWDRYLGAEIPARAHARCQTGNCGPRSSGLVNASKVPRKSGLGPLFGVMRTRASPTKSGAILNFCQVTFPFILNE